MAAKTAKAAAPKKAKADAAHPTYQDMIKMAIIQLKDRQGSSRQALKKYVQANNSLGNMTDATFNARFNSALQKGSESGLFDRPKGASGPVKLAKSTKASPPAEKKAPVEKAEKTEKTEKKAKAPATKKTTTKAAPAEKKTATKKAATKAAPKKAASAAKPKANTSKPRKTAPPAPAVENKEPVLGKTKSGRVTKNKATPAPTKKAAAPKKAKTPAKKAATPKKA